MTPVIEARGLSAGYGALLAVRSVDLHVEEGEIVTLLGPNGAGKTTTLLTLGGVLAPHQGSVAIRGSETSAPLHRRVRGGLSLVTDDRCIIRRLTVAENLRVGRCDTQTALDLFPELRPLRRRRGGLLSGGEQQMLAVGIALAKAPSILLVDELSLGLGPLIVTRLLDAIRAAADRGVGVLLVEQHVAQALRVADRAYVMNRGQIVASGSSGEIAKRLHEIEDSYLSVRDPEGVCR